MASISGVGIIGFGEAGRCLAASFAGAGVAPLTVYRRARPGVLGERPEERLPGVEITADMAGLSDRALVISVVVPSAAIDAARAFAAHGREGAFYLDLNSTAPSTMGEVERLLEPRGIRLVDGMIGGTGMRGRSLAELEIGLSGPGAQTVGARLGDLGVKIRMLGDQVGRASALKMVRGAFMKGLEPLLIETFLAARRHGLTEDVLESVSSTMNRVSFEQLLDLLLGTHLRHTRRRLDEARLIRGTVAEAGVEPLMTAAAVAWLERSRNALPTGMRLPPEQWRDVIGALDRMLAEAAEDEAASRAR